jgi:hypothetical protein
MLSQSKISSVELQEIAERIKLLRKRATEHAIEIGRELVGVKTRLPHGEFVKWVEAQCGFKIRMAQDLMKLSREAAENPDLAAIMMPSTLRVYMSNRSRSAVRNLVKTRMVTGERLTRKELLMAIADVQTRRAPARSPTEIKSSPKQAAKLDLLTAGETGIDTELEKSKKIAELLVRRLSSADLDIIMDGMTWGIWNRVLVWLRADLNVLSKGTSAPVRDPNGRVGARAA